MKTQQVTVELDDETLVHLAAYGKPADVLARLAHSVAEGVQRPEREKREATDESLRVERRTADDAVSRGRIAGEIAGAARERADQLQSAPAVETLRDVEKPATISASVAEASTPRERGGAARPPDEHASLAIERGTTDKDLLGERSLVDSVLIDQREANEHMLHATIRAHELAAEAEAERARVEQSERELREMAEFREMFIAILGHDLRNPLGAIGTGAALLLNRGHLDEVDAAIATRVARASGRITSMVGQLLDLTRARLGGGLPIEATPVDLRAICRDVVEEFDAPVELGIEGDVTGTWDADRVAEVLSNLIGNAIEYATPGTKVIVDAHADDADVVVEVTNRGEPIPVDALPYIFEPFRRAQKGATSKAGNLGLGLYIARQIALAHGGTLTARSTQGATTFTMRLPRIARRAPASRTSWSPQSHRARRAPAR